jgi:hypothetical protein
MQNADKLSIRDDGRGALLAVKVVPGSSRSRVAGVLGDCLKVSTSAAPEKGKANASVAAIIAEALGLGVRDVELIAGPTSARKEFLLRGISPAEARQRLAAVSRGR